MTTKSRNPLKQNETLANTVKIKAMGISCEVDTDLLDDLSFFADIRSLQDGDISVFPRMLKTIFGDKWNEIEKQLAENGRVRVTKATEFFMAVFEELNAKKS